jgi:hypothetical protein
LGETEKPLVFEEHGEPDVITRIADEGGADVTSKGQESDQIRPVRQRQRGASPTVMGEVTFRKVR